MKKGMIVEIRIEDMSSQGQGIGKADGFVVFVPGAVVGDLVRAEMTKVKKSYGFSRLVEIIKPSPYRFYDFDCEYLSKGCGGCQYGRLSYDAQLRLKEKQVREKLQRIAYIQDPQVKDIIGMKESDNEGNGTFRYRNKAQFHVSTGGVITRKGGVVENLGEPTVGFFRFKSHHVVDCEECCLQSPAAMAAANALRRFMEEDNITAWDPKWEKGLIRDLVVKTGFATKEVMAIVIINGNGIPNVQKLVSMMDEAVYDAGYYMESFVISVKKADKSGRQLQAVNDIMGDKNIIVAGRPVIKDILGPLEFEISPASFYQVNPVQTKRLYDKVREYCGLKKHENFDVCSEGPAERHVILDLYCGVGSIGLYCADSAEMIIGIEAVKEAVVDANRNAVINGIVNARYICGKAEEVLPAYIGGKEEEGTYDSEIAETVRKADIAILDPPRAGCKPQLLEAVAAAGVERIVYVSCDPATLARDIKFLLELGYEFKEVTPVDMFPWTGNIEAVALMLREDK